jgi:hypothetical protein
MPRQQWTSDSVIAAIQALFKGGKPLSAYAAHRTYLYRAAKRIFGSWKQAVESAGYAYPKKNATVLRDVKAKPKQHDAHTRWSDQRILFNINHRLARGLPLNKVVVEKECAPLFAAARKRYGSWPSTFAAFKIDYELVRFRRPILKPRDRQLIIEVRRPYPVEYSWLPKNHVSLDAPVPRSSTVTYADCIPFEDPFFARFERHNCLSAVMNQGRLSYRLSVVLQRIIAGYDVDDDEQQALVLAIQSTPELFALL